MIETKIKLNGSIPKENSIIVKEELQLKVSSLANIEHTCLPFYNSERLYYSYFEEIPNMIGFDGNILHPEKVMIWFEEAYKDSILKKMYRKEYFAYAQIGRASCRERV